MPRSPSLPPSSRITIAGFSDVAESMRDDAAFGGVAADAQIHHVPRVALRVELASADRRESFGRPASRIRR